MPFDYQVQVWNLDAEQPAKAVIDLHLPKGWTAARRRAEVAVAPMASQSPPPAGQPATAALEPLRPGVLRITALPAAPAKRTITFKLALERGVRLDKFDGVRVLVETASAKASVTVRLVDAGTAIWTGGASDGDDQ